MHTTSVIIRSFHGKCKMINGYESPEGASGSRPIIHARRPYQPPASSPVHAPLMSRRRRNTTCCWPQAKRIQPHVRSIPQSPQTHSKHRCNIQHGAKPRTAQPGSSSTLAYHSHQARCKALLQQQQHGASRQLQPHQSNKLALLSIPAFPVTRPHKTLMLDRKTDTHKPHSQTAMRHTAWQPPEGLLSCAQHTVNTAYLSTPSPHQIEHTEPNRCPILPSHLRTYNLTARTLLLLLLLPGS